MAVDWGKMAKTELNGDSWEESIALFKLSNVLGFNLSNVLGFYFSNYGFMKTQLMLGFERKINLAPKYEWYYSAPTKVLLHGENKIDMKEYLKASPSIKENGFTWMLAATQKSIDAFESTLKAAKEAKTIAGPSSTTCVGHTLTVTGGNSVEDIAVNKEISALGGKIQLVSGVQGVLVQSGGGRVQVLPTAVTVSATVINLG